MQAAAVVLRSPPILDPHSRCRAPDVVDVWPVGLKVGGRESNRLVKAEEALTNGSNVVGVVVEGRHRGKNPTGLHSVPGRRNLGGGGKGRCVDSGGEKPAVVEGDGEGVGEGGDDGVSGVGSLRRVG